MLKKNKQNDLQVKKKCEKRVIDSHPYKACSLEDHTFCCLLWERVVRHLFFHIELTNKI